MPGKKGKAVAKCHQCGATMEVGPFETVLRYKGHEKKWQTSGLHCPKCGEAVYMGNQTHERFEAYYEFRAEVEGVYSPKEVAAIREKLKLSQNEAGRILGGGPNAFYKYENGKQVPSEIMANLLYLLNDHPELLKDLPKAKRAAMTKQKRARSKDRAA
jgi:HTH-type transcriptional regulator/antitoxin MqsA